MSQSHRPFCVRYVLLVFMAGFLGQIFLPSVPCCKTIASPSLRGAGVVKEQLAGKAPRSISSASMKVHTIRPGDVFSDILVKAGASKKDALYISKRADKVFRLTRMKPGSELELYFSPDGARLHEIDYKVSSRKKLVLYNGKVISLFPPGMAAASPQVAQAGPGGPQEKARVRGKDLPRPGREYAHAALPSPKRPAGTKLHRVSRRDDHVQASGPETTRKARSVTARAMKAATSYRCGLPDTVRTSPHAPYEMLASGLVLLPPVLPLRDKDYFAAPGQDKQTLRGDTDLVTTAEKRSAKKKSSHKKARSGKARKTRVAKAHEPTFLRAPLSYRHVSSGFSHSRVHPLTHEDRPHLGVDFSASTGTPVHSIGAGRVSFMGWDGGYGKTIRVTHPNGYTSHYAHLSRFKRNMITGKRVKKGEIIGYVGMTGCATGPHLDFRITRRGTFLNPMTIECSSQKTPSRKNAGKSHRAPRG